MPRKVRECSVPLCTSTSASVILHNFPNPKKKGALFNAWLSAVGNNDLVNKDPEFVGRNFFVCRRHFAPQDLYPTKLVYDAVPKLHLPDPVQLPVEQSLEMVETSFDAVPKLHLTDPVQLLVKQSVEMVETSILTYDIAQIPGTSEQSASTSGLERSAPRRLEYMPLATGTKTEDEVIPSRPIAVKAKATRKKFPAEQIAEVRALKKKAAYFRKANTSTKKILKECKQHLLALQSLPPTVARFFKSQLENCLKRDKGRRFTLEDKCLALSLFKRSPRAYRLLQEIFVLPSIQTVRKTLNRIPVHPGILQSVFSCLKDSVGTMSPESKLCTLIFDEMALQPHLHYNASLDIMEGLVDYGYERRAEIADHVQVFMLRGIFKRWKQPVAFIFCKSTASAPVICRIFKELIREATAIGLTVIASVCNQGATNCRAINMLREETRANALRRGEEPEDGVIVIGDKTIIPLFDPPHLLKCMRNNLLTKDLLFCQEGTNKVAKWSHVVDAYHIDRSLKLRVLTKLTDFHVFPAKIRKMKVSSCTQVFSRHFAAVLGSWSTGQTHSRDGHVTLGEGAQDTADLCFIFNQIFDSVNGSYSGRNRVVLRGPVTAVSKHEAVWCEGISLPTELCHR